MRTYVVDIETRSDTQWLEREDATQIWIDKLRPPGNYRKPEAIQGWIEQQLTDRADKAPLSPLDGRIVAIGWVDLDSADIPSVAAGDDEADILRSFADAAACADRIAGWYVRNFDVPFLTARAAVHGVALPNWWPHARDYRRILDGADLLTSGSLQQWLLRLQLPGKTASGADVASMTIAEVAEYCRNDVHVERLLLRRLGMHNHRPPTNP